MTSSVPTMVTLVVLLMSVAVLVGRLSLLRGTTACRLVNLALVFGVMSGLARERPVQIVIVDASSGILEVALLEQIGTVALVVALAPLIAIAARWHHAGWRTSSTAGLIGAALLSGGVMLAVGSEARGVGEYIDVLPGWRTGVYFVVFFVWAALMPLMYLRVSIRELRRGQLSRQVALTFVLFVVLTLWGFEEALSILCMGLLASTGYAPGFVAARVEMNEFSFTYLLAVAVVCAALPLWRRAAELLEVDRWSRSSRLLTPMWSELVLTCPEVVLPRFSSPGPQQRVHRMCVEIRDALSLLGRYLGDESDWGAVDNRSRAQLISCAAQRKRSDAVPGSFRRVPISQSADLGGEVAALSALGRHWPPADTAVLGNEGTRP